MDHVAPKAVGIAGQRFQLRFRCQDSGSPIVRLLDLPPFAEIVDSEPVAIFNENLTSGHYFALTLRALRTGRGIARLELNGRLFSIPIVVFREREFFLCMVLSSNHHWGWDPLSYIFGGTPEDLQLEGDAWPKLRQLEKMYHMRGLPITWLIDDRVAAKANSQIEQWHLDYGDDYGVMPSSYIHHNAVNWNTIKTQDEITGHIRQLRDCTEEQFSFYTNNVAVDQFIGSVGSKFVEAAYQLGFHGIWGVGFDHRTCDTSMYHRGCPWDVYRPDRSNYRIPASHPGKLWMWQWTTRDVHLSMRSADDGPSGAVIFSTDPDDQRCSRIMFEQPEYWEKLFKNYVDNFAASMHGMNDCFCFLMHQEDHDCGFPENADLLRRFLDHRTDGATPATLEEVAAWLNLKYETSSHPAQIMHLRDELECHDKVVWFSSKKPADWPNDGQKYPPAIAFYNDKQMWIASEGEYLPFRYFDYTQRTPCREEDAYPERDLRKLVRVLKCDYSGHHLSLEVESGEELQNIPLILWNARVTNDVLSNTEHVIRIGDNIILFCDVIKGLQTLTFHLKS